MQVQVINNSNNISFSSRFKLLDKTIKIIESSTGLTYKEMTSLPLNETEKLMEKRGTLKKAAIFKTWIADKYRKLGEILGVSKRA